MGVRCHQQRATLGRDRSSSELPSFLPGSHSSAGVFCPDSAGLWGYREDKLPCLSRTPLFCSQEGHRQKTSHPRFLHSEQACSLRLLQDDHGRKSSPDPPSGCLDRLSRPEGGVLPRPNPPKLPEVPRLPHRRPEVPFPRPSFRPQHRAKGFHTSYNVVVARLREKGVWAVAYLDDGLFWSDSSLACAQARDVALQVLVSTTTIPAIRVARYRLEYTNHHVQHPPSQEKGDPASHQVLSGS